MKPEQKKPVDGLENEMVLAFLAAEIDSNRFGYLYVDNLGALNLGRDLIDKAHLNSERENASRRLLLGSVRGYGKNEALFTGFPRDAVWRKGAVNIREVKYANYHDWVALSGGTRLVMDGAGACVTGKLRPYLDLAKSIEKGKHFPELIVADTGANGIVLIEGHTRATAYAIVSPETPREAFIATSPSLFRTWTFV
jgi:hypothetical protein